MRKVSFESAEGKTTQGILPIPLGVHIHVPEVITSRRAKPASMARLKPADFLASLRKFTQSYLVTHSRCFTASRR